MIGFDRNPEGLSLARKDGFDMVIDKDIQNETFDGFDALVTLETVEHLQRPYDFIKGLSSTVKEIVLSVPCIPTKHFNEWHLHDFTREEMVTFLKEQGWKVEAEATQNEPGLPSPTYLLVYATR